MFSTFSEVIFKFSRCHFDNQKLFAQKLGNCINGVVCSGVLHVGISDHNLIYVIRKL